MFNHHFLITPFVVLKPLCFSLKILQNLLVIQALVYLSHMIVTISNIDDLSTHQFNLHDSQYHYIASSYKKQGPCLIKTIKMTSTHFIITFF